MRGPSEEFSTWRDMSRDSAFQSQTEWEGKWAEFTVRSWNHRAAQINTHVAHSWTVIKQ